MGVYNVNGDTVVITYDKSGTAVSLVYDKNGIVVSNVPSEINNIVSYFRVPTIEVQNEIDALSSDWENIVFITDPHGNGNQQHSQAIGLYLLHNANVEMLVLGGDYSIINWAEAQYTNYTSPLSESDVVSNIYALMGNHETMGSGSPATAAKQKIYTDFLAAKNLQNGNPAEVYYYIDDQAKKIRYLFINTSDSGSAYVMTQTQIDWIANSVVLPDTSWSLVVFGHVNLAKMANVTTQNESNGTDIIAAINNCNGTIVGYFCGHQHIDYCEKIGNFQHTTFQCDKLETNNYYSGISFTDRSAGNTTEQAVTVISINTTLRQVVTRRIGAARQATKTMSYTY